MILCLAMALCSRVMGLLSSATAVGTQSRIYRCVGDYLTGEAGGRQIPDELEALPQK